MANRPLDRVYPVMFIDAVHVEVRDGQVTNRPMYVAIGVTVSGERDILGKPKVIVASRVLSGAALQVWVVVKTARAVPDPAYLGGRESLAPGHNVSLRTNDYRPTL